eukprot:TRINITY_DN9026_c0_g2_i1.p1 TRINITY_DN9026_c0_g2~~TRINITY_DN9026_c0_g2_i1.p1  ORF type:complete len:508 (-),score=44.65 TRINITY_DN9026_c0_g2_i1:171-1694(-)
MASLCEFIAPEPGAPNARYAGVSSARAISGGSWIKGRDIDHVAKRGAGVYSPQSTPKQNHREVKQAIIPLEGSSMINRNGSRLALSPASPWSDSTETMSSRPQVSRRYSSSSLDFQCRPSSCDPQQTLTRTTSEKGLDRIHSSRLFLGDLVSGEDHFLGRKGAGLCSPSSRSNSVQPDRACCTVREGTRQGVANKWLFGLSRDVDRPCGRRGAGSYSARSGSPHTYDGSAGRLSVSPPPQRHRDCSAGRFRRRSEDPWIGTSAQIELNRSTAVLERDAPCPAGPPQDSVSSGPTMPPWVMGLRETRVDIRRLMRVCSSAQQPPRAAAAPVLSSTRSDIMSTASDTSLGENLTQSNAMPETLPSPTEPLKVLSAFASKPRERLLSSSLSTTASISGVLSEGSSASGTDASDQDRASLSGLLSKRVSCGIEPLVAGNDSRSGYGSPKTYHQGSLGARQRPLSARRGPFLATADRSGKRQAMKAARNMSPPSATFGAQSRFAALPLSTRG